MIPFARTAKMEALAQVLRNDSHCFTFDTKQLTHMKQTCQRHCFSTLNHNLGYCYNDARVIKWLWKQARNKFPAGARSFED